MVRSRGPFGHPGQRLVAAGRIPVMPAWSEPRFQVAEQGLLELLPSAGRLPPAPVSLGPFQPGRESFHGVVERPAERRLADHVAAVAGHAAVHVGPACDDRERLSVLQNRDPVPFLEPQRFQRAGLQRRPSAGVLGLRGRHQRRAPGVQPGLIGRLRSGPVVGDPGGRYRRAVVVQVGGRGQAVVFDGHVAAPVGTETLQQRDRRLRLARSGGFWMRGAHDRKCTDSTAPHKPHPRKGTAAVNPAPYPGVAAGKSLNFRTELSVSFLLTGIRSGGFTRTGGTGAYCPGRRPPGAREKRAAAAAPPG